LGIWACRWRELKPISFGGGGATTGGDVEQPQAMMDIEANGGDGVGFVQSIRNLGSDSGAYEMVDRNETV